MQACAYEHTFPNPISNKKIKTDEDKEQSSEKQYSNRFICYIERTNLLVFGGKDPAEEQVKP